MHKKWKEKNPKKFPSIIFYFFLPPENPPEDRNSGIRSFTGPDGPGSTSKTTGRTGYSIYSPEKRPGQPEINFTGFLDTLVFAIIIIGISTTALEFTIAVVVFSNNDYSKYPHYDIYQYSQREIPV